MASAYLCVFDDWHLLYAAIASIAPRVDEIVVVDGGYAWMAPFLTANGRDPARSDPRVAEALAPFADKLVWINQVWTNEVQKRAAGYAACRHRHIYRVDSDEVLFFDEDALARFFASDAAVAEMDMPIAVSPALIRGEPGARIERQALLFDRDRIGPMEHLGYLWLVLPPAERAQLGEPVSARIFADPIAFNAHLTHWRPPATAVNRARFYVLNYLREGTALHFAPHAAYTPADGFAALLDIIPAGRLTEYLMGHAIVAGAPGLQGRGLIPTPLAPAQIATFAPLYDACLAALAALNADLAVRPRTIVRGDGVLIDISTPAALAPFLRDGRIHLRFSLPLAAAQVGLLTLWSQAPWETEESLPWREEPGGLSLELPPLTQPSSAQPSSAQPSSAQPVSVEPGDAVRRTLRVAIWTHAPDTFLTLSAPPLVAAQDGLIAPG